MLADQILDVYNRTIERSCGQLPFPVCLVQGSFGQPGIPGLSARTDKEADAYALQEILESKSIYRIQFQKSICEPATNASFLGL